MRVVRIFLAAAVLLGLASSLATAAPAAAATLSGVVEGQPAGGEAERLAGVEVLALEAGTEKTVNTTTTNELGKYSLELAPGAYDVRFDPGAESPFKATTVKAVEVKTSRTLNVLLVQAKLAHLTGTLRDAEGDPVPGASFALYDETNRSFSTTAAGGSFALSGPAANDYTLQASGTSAGSSSLPDTWFFSVRPFALASDRQLDLQFPPASQLTIEVQGAEGEPVPAASVYLPILKAQADLGEDTTTPYLESGGGLGSGLHGTTGEQGRVAFTVFGGGPVNAYERVRVDPPSGSGYGSASVVLPEVEGDTTMVVSLQGAGEEEPPGEEEPKDSEAPKLDELGFEPSEIDVGPSAQTVTVGAHISDDVSGLEKATIHFTSPSGKAQSWALFERIGGDANAGTYIAEVPFEQMSEAGAWKATVAVADVVGNWQELDAGDLDELGFPHAVLVENSGEAEPAEDAEAPRLKGIAIEPEEIDTSEAKQGVTAELHLTDDLSGVKNANFYFRSPSGKQWVLASGSKLVSGTKTDGVFRLFATFPRYAENGAWQIANVRATDFAGHEAVVEPAQIEAAGFPHTVYVGGGVADVESPQLPELTIEPTTIDTSSSSQTVMLSARIVDDLSGFAQGIVVFGPGEGEAAVFGAGFERVSGDAQDGVYEIPVTFEQGSQLGPWDIEVIRLTDQTGNEAVLEPAQIEAAGLPHTVTVGGPPPSVSAVSPGSGSEAGGTEVQIAGSGFGGATAVRFGGSSAEFEVQSPSSIVAYAPPGTGTVDVTVTTPSGTSEATAANRFQYVPPVSLSSSPNPSVRGQKVTFTASVTPLAAGAPAPLGTVVFVEGTNTLGVVNLKKGTATLSTTTLGAGKHPVVAVYSGDANFGSGESEALSQVVAKAQTETTLASSLDPAPFGSGAKLKATVEALAPGAGTPAGTVTFREGEAVLDTVQLAGRSATLALKDLPPGTHAITAAYNGDANDEPSEAAYTQTIVRAETETTLTSTLNPAPYGSAAKLKATVDAVAPALGAPSGTVVFREGEAVLAMVPLSGSGVATYALKSTEPGNHPITVSFEGNAEYEASEAAIEQLLTPAETETTLTSTLNPAPYGSGASVKATVKVVAPGGGTPAGTVTFWEGETVLATVPLAAGSAKYAIKGLAPGTHSIKATYSGDGEYGESLDGIEQVVTQAATDLNLTSTKNPAPSGSGGTIKATVKAVAPGGGTPLGSVVFREGETVLAVVPLASGSATYPLKSLAVGTHEVTASYGGSASYGASSGSIAQVIEP